MPNTLIFMLIKICSRISDVQIDIQGRSAVLCSGLALSSASPKTNKSLLYRMNGMKLMFSSVSYCDRMLELA